MKILVIALNYAPEPIGCAKYTSQLCVELAKKYSHDVRVYSAAPYYPDWKTYQEYRAFRAKNVYLNNVLVTRMRIYVPKRPNAFNRLIHLLSFSVRLLFQVPNMLLFKPNVVVVILPTLVSVPIAKLICFLSKARLHIHVQDLEFGVINSISNTQRKLFTLRALTKTIFSTLERSLIKMADSLSTISNTMQRQIRNILDEPNRRIPIVRNWYDNPTIDKTDYFSKLRAGRKIALYSGALGRKQGLDIILQAARELQTNKHCHDWLFIIAGDGAAKEMLVRKCKQFALKNVIFCDLFPDEHYLSAFSSADIHIVPQLSGVSDFVLPSKLSTLWGLGCKTIVAASATSEISSIHREFPGICDVYEPEDLTSLLGAIDAAPDKHFDKEVCISYARNFLDKDKNIRNLHSEINYLNEK